MVGNTGFTEKVRELLRKKDSATPKEIMKAYGDLIKDSCPGGNLNDTKDIHYIGAGRLGVWYLEGKEEQARKSLEKLRLESENRRRMRDKKQYEKMHLPRNPSIRSCLDLFKTDDDTYTVREIWKRMGGSYKEVSFGVSALAKGKILFCVGENPKRYKRNPEYAMICDGAYEAAQKGIFKNI